MNQSKHIVKSCFLGTRVEAFRVLQIYTKIIEVITVKNSYVYNYCVSNNISVYIVSKENKEQCFNYILSIEADLFFSVGFPYIIPEEVLLKKRRLYNSHPSLLPDYRGYHAITEAFDNKERYMGVTVHKMVAEPDAGPIVEQESVFVNGLSLDDIYKMLFSVVEPMVIAKSIVKIFQLEEIQG
jgi:methionyl-tRNA formyltransferase